MTGLCNNLIASPLILQSIKNPKPAFLSKTPKPLTLRSLQHTPSDANPKHEALENGPTFAELVDEWSAKGMVKQWQGTVGQLEEGGRFVPLPSSPPRYIGVNGMRPLADAMLSQPNSPLVSRKQHDEEDNCLHSAATSVRRAKFKTTVPVCPVFRSTDRASKRREFYTKLEEKNQALEAEKIESQARTKLPLTRPKSPKLSRRKSSGDAACSSTGEKGVCTRAIRHSLGNSPTAKNKEQTIRCNGNGACKVKDSPKRTKERARTTPHEMTEERSADITVNS